MGFLKTWTKDCIQSYSWSLLEFHIWYIYIEFFRIYLYSFFSAGRTESERQRETWRRRSDRFSSENTGTFLSLLISNMNHESIRLWAQKHKRKQSWSKRDSRRTETISENIFHHKIKWEINFQRKLSLLKAIICCYIHICVYVYVYIY